MGYKTIEGSSEARFIERKSEFIGYLKHTANEQEALDFIAEIRAMHRKAKHNCYAYIIRENNISRHSDDGEPQGTAGAPIYEVLSKEGLCDVTCVVTRYFGGILLGTGGLVRAYTRAANEAAGAARVLDMQTASKLSLKLSYSFYGRVDRLISEYGAIKESEDFGSDVSIVLYVRSEKESELIKKLTDACDGSIVAEKLSETEYNFAKR